MFARAREKARQTSCLSNVKQITLGALMYVQDNDDTTFGHIQGIRYPVQVSGILNWAQQMFPYVMNEDLFTCPSHATGTWSYDADPSTPAPTRDNNFGYGMNYWMTYYYEPSTLADFPKPAETIWFTDCNFYVVYPSYYLHLYPDNATYGLNGTARLQNRHNEGANVGFLDGHAKWLSRSVLEGDIGGQPSDAMWWGGVDRPRNRPTS